MTGWLAGWSQPVPSPAVTGMSGGSMGAMGSGMMSDADMVRSTPRAAPRSTAGGSR